MKYTDEEIWQSIRELQVSQGCLDRKYASIMTQQSKELAAKNIIIKGFIQRLKLANETCACIQKKNEYLIAIIEENLKLNLEVTANTI